MYHKEQEDLREREKLIKALLYQVFVMKEKYRYSDKVSLIQIIWMGHFYSVGHLRDYTNSMFILTVIKTTRAKQKDLIEYKLGFI